MNNVSNLLVNNYTAHPYVKQVYDLIVKNKNKNININLVGLFGSSKGIVFTSLINLLKTNKSHLVILNDKEEALFFFNDLESLNTNGVNLFFPSSYKREFDTDETLNANVILRMEALSSIKMNNFQQKVIVTFPEALYEKVANKQIVEKETYLLKKGQKIKHKVLVEILEKHNFHLVDMVSMVGQYAVRGNIIDIYSFSDDYPIRIEFNDITIESIRQFDFISQLSKKELDEFILFPNFSQMKIENRESILKFLGSDTIVWTNNKELILKKINTLYNSNFERYNEKETTIKLIDFKDLFINSNDIEAEFENRINIELNSKKSGVENFFNFGIKQNEIIKKNYELLKSNIENENFNSITTFVACTDDKQKENINFILESNIKKLKVNYLPYTLNKGFTDDLLNIVLYTDHEIFDRYHRYKLKENVKNDHGSLAIKELKSYNIGDLLVHLDYGVGLFAGLEKINIQGKKQEAIKLFYANNDILYVSIHSLHKLSKYSFDASPEGKLDKLGSNRWKSLKAKTKSKLKELAFNLIELYAKRKLTKGFSFSSDTYLQHEFESSFEYEDTPDQIKATNEIKNDMENIIPMDRLVCGDVGFGKTEVSMRAAFKAVSDSKQVAVLVPTTILCLQHYKTFTKRFKNFPCNIDYISRFRTKKEENDILNRLVNGKIDIIIGTHKLISKKILFKNLGLLIIDEEQKFGVSIKDKLKANFPEVDILTLTATPIPRTLQFSLLGARDLSIINTPPPNRQSIQTELHTFNEEIIRNAIKYEIGRNGQVFFIENRIQSHTDICGIIQRLVPDAKIRSVNGRMVGDKLEEVMLDFMEGKFDVLVSTSLVESGLDISKANTIIINNANFFGLSDLHQLRGRVGRSNTKAFCYLLSKPVIELTPEARKRLLTIEEYSDLNNGLNVALKDLEIRGAGNLFGPEQSGFINEMGMETYHKILDEAVSELKQNEFKDLFKEENSEIYAKECIIETDLQLLIPDKYVENTTERMNLYKTLSNLKSIQEFDNFLKELKDRFGPIPNEIFELVESMELKLKALNLGFEKIILKNSKMITYFISSRESKFFDSEKFTRILNNILKLKNKATLYQTDKRVYISFMNVNCVRDAFEYLKILES